MHPSACHLPLPPPLHKTLYSGGVSSGGRLKTFLGFGFLNCVIFKIELAQTVFTGSLTLHLSNWSRKKEHLTLCSANLKLHTATVLHTDMPLCPYYTPMCLQFYIKSTSCRNWLVDITDYIETKNIIVYLANVNIFSFHISTEGDFI